VAARLSFAEREEIALGLARGQSCRQIAVGPGRSHTTITREVATHSLHRHAVTFNRPGMA
jgi:IS30 family transposase